MVITWTLLDLAGSVALLLWGVHMVQTGIQRGFGPDLRRFLGTALRQRLGAFAAGLGVTAILQSSTATGLMVAGFAAGGAVDLVPALAVMLGANVGTTLIVQLMSFDVASVAPALILIGVVAFRRGSLARTRDLGRVAIGLGLMLMALHQLVSLVTPYEDMPNMRIVLGALNTQPLLDVLVAAGLTWMAHSSVAVVLLTISFAAKGAIPPDAAFALVLGANLGTAINPVLEGTAGDDPVGRRLPIGNLLNRVAGCAIGLALLDPVGRWMVVFEPDAARAVADFHTGFNIALAAVFLPLLGPYAALLRWMLPARVRADEPGQPRYLDQTALGTPPIALAAASREALRMADSLEALLLRAGEVLNGSDRRQINDVRRLDDVLDRLNTAIKEYLTSLDPDAQSENDQRRVSEILIFTTNLEAAGDVVDRDLMGLAAKRLKRGQPFPEADCAEAQRLLTRLAGSVRAAAAVFMTEDARAARELVTEKESFRDMEAAATRASLIRERSTATESGPGMLDLELLRALKRVNGHVVAAAAYPVLEGQGELLASRLRLDS